MKTSTSIVGAVAMLTLAACPRPPPELSSLTLSPETASLAMGDQVQFVATAYFTDGQLRDVSSEALWSVDDAFVGGTSDETKGLVTGLHVGQTVVRARFGGKNVTRTLSVVSAQLRELQIDPPHPTLPVGLSVAVKVIAIRSDGTTQDVTSEAVWLSSSPSIATVEGSSVFGRAPGALTITASVQGLAVTAPVDITDAHVESIDVQPSTVSLAVGFSHQLTATALMNDGSSLDVTGQAAWRSSAAEVASASALAGEAGLISGRAVGSARISASLLGKSGASEVTVTSAHLVSLELGPGLTALANGTSQQFSATGAFSDGTTADLTRQVAWSSGNPAVFTAVAGWVDARGVGRAQLMASHGAVRVSRELQITGAALTSIELRPTPVVVARGLTIDVVAIAGFSDGTQQDLTRLVLWRVLDPSKASVSNASSTAGRVSGTNEGTTELSASISGLSARATLTVSSAALASVQVTPTAPTLARGTTRAFTATGVFTDGTSQDLTAQATWASSSPRVTVSSQGASRGEAQAIAQGTAELRATVGGRSGSTVVTVSDAVLIAIEVTPTSPRLPLGLATRFVATGRFSDGSAVDLTTQVTWSSHAPSIASVSNAPGTEGEVRPLALGSAQLTAQLGEITGATTVMVSDASITSLELSPAGATIAAGLTRGFSAVATYSDGTSQDVTTQTSFSTLDPAIASVAGAIVTGHTAGSSTLVGTAMGLSASAELLVTPAQVTALTITPPSLTLARGTRGQLLVEASFTDGTSADVTTQVTWSSTDASIVTVSNAAGSEGALTALSMGTATVRAQLGSSTASSAITISPATLSTIELTPTLSAMPLGATRRFTATGRYSDGSAQDLSTQAAWSSSAASVLSISNAPGLEGEASARSQGEAVITATFSGLTGTTRITVTAAALSEVQLSPPEPRIARDTRIALSATGVWSDGGTQELTSTCTWSSSSPLVATVSNAPGSRGRVTGQTAGVATITASCSGVTGSLVLTVTNATLLTIEVTPAAPTAAAGFSQALTATGVFSDGTTQAFSDFVNWSSADSSKATVSAVGLVSARAQGSVIISAQALGVTGTVSFVVSAAVLQSIELAPDPAVVPRGLNQAFVALGHFSDGSTAEVSESATWSSSDLNVATVSNAAGSRGQATAIREGSTTISATLSGHTARALLTVTAASLSTIAVTPFSPSVPKGLSLQFTAMGTFSDGTTRDLTTQVTWSSSDGQIASISNVDPSVGRAMGLAPGSVTITATLGSVSGQTSLTVTPAVLQQLEVTPQNVSVPKGLSQQFTAMGLFSDGTTTDVTSSVTWSSSDETKVVISNAGGRGLASTKAVGTVIVSATRSGVSGSTPFTVTAAVLSSITLTPGGSTASLGSVRQYAAIGNYTDASTQNLSTQALWNSSNPAVASVSNASGSQGLATTLSTGVTSISAAFQGFTAAVNLVVIQNSLTSIEITPASGSTALGYSRQFIAIGTYADGTTQVLTNTVTWASDDTTVAIVSNADGSRGLLSTVGVGNVTITATHQGITGSTGHAVTPAVLVAITIAPDPVSLTTGSTSQLTATGFFSDGSAQDLTTTVTWTSSVTSVAQVSNAAGSEGLLTGVAAGQAQVSATQGGLSTSAQVTVQ